MAIIETARAEILNHSAGGSADLAGVKLFLQHSEIVPKEPDTRLLCEILKHFSVFPYENMTKILKLEDRKSVHDPRRLPLEIIEDYLAMGTGGTCYSLTYFLKAILEYCGFTCYPASANMPYGEDMHCALITIVDGCKYLCDPGYLLREPLLIPHSGSLVYNTAVNQLVLQRVTATNEIRLHVIRKGISKLRYVLKDVPLDAAEFDRLWMRSFDFRLMSSLVITKGCRDGQLFLHNQRMQVITAESRKIQKIKSNYASVIAEWFHLPKHLIERARQVVESKKSHGQTGG